MILKPREQALFPVQPVSEVSTHRSWAIYGRSGTGKTTFASTFPPPILLLDIDDQGTDSVKDVKNLFVGRVSEWEDFTDIYELAKTGKYKSIIFDTVTQMQLMAANMILARKRKPAIQQLDWGSLTMQDYGDLAALMKDQITKFRNLPMEVVFLAQERTSHDENTDETLLVPEVGPAVTPSVASHLNASVSVIASTFIKRRKRKKGKDEVVEAVYSMRIGPSPVYVTKVRKPKSIIIPSDIEDPTFRDVVEIIEGHE